MKVKDILLFIVAVLAVLASISAFFPKNGIALTGGYSLQFTTLEEFFGTEEEETVVALDDIMLKNINLDSLFLKGENTDDDSLVIDAAELKKTIQPLEFGSESPSDLDNFYEALRSVKSESRLIRVMHYGDSQIESDRISSFLRYKLQNQFGGSGLGLQPVVQPFDYRFALLIQSSSNWERYASYGSSSKKAGHRKFGPLASFCRFSPLLNDSTPVDTILHNATIDVSPDKGGYAGARSFRTFRMIYGNNRTPVGVKLSVNGVTFTDTLPATQNVQVKKWVFDEAVNTLTLTLSSYHSPDVYALAFDGAQGVAVDNIALRGNSGTLFTSLDQNNLSQGFNHINTKLFILQFGGNVLPWIDSEKACKNYAQQFGAQIRRLKNAEPGSSVIVVGPADKSVKEKTKYVSYTYVEPLIKEMKEATFNAGAAYWDVYKAMGGNNSMPVWVKADLAGPDYIHFSPAGASVIANMLYNAIIYDYNNYLKEKQTSDKLNKN